MITREEWLRYLVETIDRVYFDGDLDIPNHEYQISVGRQRGKRQSETVQPSDSEQVTLDDFFPTTISIDWTIRDVYKMATQIAFECIPAFLGEFRGKALKKIMTQYFFDPPYNEPNPSPYGMDLIKSAVDEVIKKHGKYPGKAVKYPVKEPKPKKKTQYTIFCPECGMEYIVKKSMLDKHGWMAPTCPYCVMKMGIDQEDEQEESNDATDENINKTHKNTENKTRS